MRQIDRIDLISRIGRELQGRMGYGDIDIFLRGFDVDTSQPTSGTNSKWVYVKELLADEPEQKILRIADELEIDHGLTSPAGRDISDSPFWIPGYFRLFISHLSSFKQKTAALRDTLRAYGISAFVAHEDIEPTREWQDEIEKALLSMDALAAILMPGFHESKWTDQEIGVALGRELLVIPVRRGLDPYGFIGKYQGFQGIGKTVAEVAAAIFEVLVVHDKSRVRLAENLMNLLLTARNDEHSNSWLQLLHRFRSIPPRLLEKLQSGVGNSPEMLKSPVLMQQLTNLFEKHGTHLDLPTASAAPEPESDIPF